MEKNFAVTTNGLFRKSVMVIIINFKKTTVSFHKLKNGKEIKSQFPVNGCSELIKSVKNPSHLTVSFFDHPVTYHSNNSKRNQILTHTNNNHHKHKDKDKQTPHNDAKPFTKEIIFSSFEDRELFVQLVEALIDTQGMAYTAFMRLNSNSNNNNKNNHTDQPQENNNDDNNNNKKDELLPPSSSLLLGKNDSLINNHLNVQTIDALHQDPDDKQRTIQKAKSAAAVAVEAAVAAATLYAKNELDKVRLTTKENLDEIEFDFVVFLKAFAHTYVTTLQNKAFSDDEVITTL